MALPKSEKRKRFHHFDGFQDRIHDFVWVLDWKQIGKPYCHLYIIGPKDRRPVKIGVSVGCYKRLAGIQTGNWHDLYVLKSVWLNSVKDARKLEAETHRALQEHHLSGEWFDVNAAAAFEAVEHVANHYGLELHSGIPDEPLVGHVFDTIRSLMEDEHLVGSDEAQKIRIAKLSEFGITRTVNDAVRAREQEFDEPFVAKLEAERAARRH